MERREVGKGSLVGWMVVGWMVRREITRLVQRMAVWLRHLRRLAGI